MLNLLPTTPALPRQGGGISIYLPSPGGRGQGRGIKSLNLGDSKTENKRPFSARSPLIQFNFAFPL